MDLIQILTYFANEKVGPVPDVTSSTLERAFQPMAWRMTLMQNNWTTVMCVGLPLRGSIAFALLPSCDAHAVAVANLSRVTSDLGTDVHPQPRAIDEQELTSVSKKLAILGLDHFVVYVPASDGSSGWLVRLELLEGTPPPVAISFSLLQRPSHSPANVVDPPRSLATAN